MKHKNIKLKALLSERVIKEAETTAADQAHKLGLVYKGWGRWADETGQVVAKSVNGQLVKLESPDTPDSPAPEYDEYQAGSFFKYHPKGQELKDTLKNSALADSMRNNKNKNLEHEVVWVDDQNGTQIPVVAEYELDTSDGNLDPVVYGIYNTVGEPIDMDEKESSTIHSKIRDKAENDMADRAEQDAEDRAWRGKDPEDRARYG